MTALLESINVESVKYLLNLQYITNFSVSLILLVANYSCILSSFEILVQQSQYTDLAYLLSELPLKLQLQIQLQGMQWLSSYHTSHIEIYYDYACTRDLGMTSNRLYVFCIVWENQRVIVVAIATIHYSKGYSYSYMVI